MCEKCKHPPRRPINYIAILSFLLVLVSILLIKTQIDLYSQPIPLRHLTSHDTSHAEIYSTNKITRTFQDIPALENISRSFDDEWSDLLLPPGGGVIFVESDKNEMGIEMWGISMFHGLHCVQLLRSALQDAPQFAEAAGPKLDPLIYGNHEDHLMHEHAHKRNLASSNHKKHHEPFLKPNHIMHCIGYLAQHLICAADTTVEPPWYDMDESGRVTSGVDGITYEHQCRNPHTAWEIALATAETPMKPWDWKMGDRVEDVFHGDKAMELLP